MPTTYSGAEWAPGFGVRTPERRIVGGGGGAHLAGIVYDVRLTLDLPRPETVGTAMNALAHCAEALYVTGHNPEATSGPSPAPGRSPRYLPAVVESPHAQVSAGPSPLGQPATPARRWRSPASASAHAMAQALGGTFGLPHGAMNALTLAPALRFNAPLAPDAVARFGEAIGAPDDPAAKVEELARLGGFERLRDFGVPEDEPPAVAEAAAGATRQPPEPATRDACRGRGAPPFHLDNY